MDYVAQFKRKDLQIFIRLNQNNALSAEKASFLVNFLRKTNPEYIRSIHDVIEAVKAKGSDRFYISSTHGGSYKWSYHLNKKTMTMVTLETLKHYSTESKNDKEDPNKQEESVFEVIVEKIRNRTLVIRNDRYIHFDSRDASYLNELSQYILGEKPSKLVFRCRYYTTAFEEGISCFKGMASTDRKTIDFSELYIMYRRHIKKIENSPKSGFLNSFDTWPKIEDNIQKGKIAIRNNSSDIQHITRVLKKCFPTDSSAIQKSKYLFISMNPTIWQYIDEIECQRLGLPIIPVTSIFSEMVKYEDAIAAIEPKKPEECGVSEECEVSLVDLLRPQPQPISIKNKDLKLFNKPKLLL